MSETIAEREPEVWLRLPGVGICGYTTGPPLRQVVLILLVGGATALLGLSVGRESGGWFAGVHWTLGDGGWIWHIGWGWEDSMPLTPWPYYKRFDDDDDGGGWALCWAGLFLTVCEPPNQHPTTGRETP